MNTERKIIYTESAKDRLEKFHFEVNKEIESYLHQRKYVPGDDFIEVTGLDIDEVSHRFRIIKHPSSRYIKTLIPLIYAMIGFGALIGGVFYNQILLLLKDDPQRLTLIGTGLAMMGMSLVYYYLIKIRDKKDEIERSISTDKVIISDLDEIKSETVSRVIPGQKIIIHTAKYFFEKNYFNVTSKIKELVDKNIFEFTVNNDLMGGDPAHGKVKTLEIEYTIDGVRKKISSVEGTIIKLD